MPPFRLGKEDRRAVLVTLSLRRVQGKNLNTAFFAELLMTKNAFPIFESFIGMQSERHASLAGGPFFKVFLSYNIAG
jgi:hypothetical protein